MTIEEACKLWVDRDFTCVSHKIFQNTPQESCDNLTLLTGDEPELDYPCGWEWMYHPESRTDEEWLRDHIEEVEECGFMMYESVEYGLLLGIDAAGYSFVRP